MLKFQNSGKGDSNPDSFYSEFGILPLSYHTPEVNKSLLKCLQKQPETFSVFAYLPRSDQVSLSSPSWR